MVVGVAVGVAVGGSGCGSGCGLNEKGLVAEQWMYWCGVGSDISAMLHVAINIIVPALHFLTDVEHADVDWWSVPTFGTAMEAGFPFSGYDTAVAEQFRYSLPHGLYRSASCAFHVTNFVQFSWGEIPIKPTHSLSNPNIGWRFYIIYIYIV